MQRRFNGKLYYVLDSKAGKDDAEKLAKDWRKEGFSIRITLGPRSHYLVWKSIERSEKALALRRKAYRSNK